MRIDVPARRGHHIRLHTQQERARKVDRHLDLLLMPTRFCTTCRGTPSSEEERCGRVGVGRIHRDGWHASQYHAAPTRFQSCPTALDAPRRIPSLPASRAPTADGGRSRHLDSIVSNGPSSLHCCACTPVLAADHPDGLVGQVDNTCPPPRLGSTGGSSSLSPRLRGL